MASHWVAVPYEKLIDWIRKYLSLIGFIVAAIGVFFTDAVSNGDQNFVAWDIDISSKKAKVRYYSLK